MTFVKLHGSILDSSIWLESPTTRLVWITMLAMADADGIVSASVGGLAHRAHVEREDCLSALATFLGPDEDSRDGTTGERIEKVPGGWLLLNHANYRDRRTRTQELTAARVRKHRAKRKRDGNAVTDGHAVSAPEAEADTEAEAEPKKKSTRSRARPLEGFDEFWDAYDKKRSRPKAEVAWRKQKPDEEVRATIIAQAKAYREATPDKQFRKDPATWLNQRCWEDEILPANNGKPRHTSTATDAVDIQGIEDI